MESKTTKEPRSKGGGGLYSQKIGDSSAMGTSKSKTGRLFKMGTGSKLKGPNSGHALPNSKPAATSLAPALPLRPNSPPAGGRPPSSRVGKGSRWARVRPICPSLLEGQHCHWGACCYCQPASTTPKVVGLLASSVPPINVPFSCQSSGPMCPQEGTLVGEVHGLRFTVPLDPGPTSLEVSRHPDSSMYAWGLEGTGSADGSSRASHEATAPQSCTQVRPAPAEVWGWVCVGRGRRRERHSPKPAGEAQKGCHPLTRSSDPPPLLPGWARAAAKITLKH